MTKRNSEGAARATEVSSRVRTAAELGATAMEEMSHAINDIKSLYS